jgi:hypothetical protein
VEIVIEEAPVAVRNVAKDWNADLAVISRRTQTGIRRKVA